MEKNFFDLMFDPLSGYSREVDDDIPANPFEVLECIGKSIEGNAYETFYDEVDVSEIKEKANGATMTLEVGGAEYTVYVARKS